MTDDVDFVCKLKRSLVKDLNLNKLNCFLCGMSNGGEMCYLTALQRPEEFTAYGSVAGLTMEWFYRKYSMRKAVPFLEVHGDADKTSRWDDDRTTPEDGENTLPSRLPLRKYLFLNNGIDPSLAAFVLKQHNEFELTVASSFMKTALLDQIVGIPAQHV